MELAKESDSVKNRYHIDHHGVYRPEKCTIRLRVSLIRQRRRYLDYH